MVFDAPSISQSQVCWAYLLRNLAKGWASCPLTIIFPNASGQAVCIQAKLSGAFWSGRMKTFSLDSYWIRATRVLSDVRSLIWRSMKLLSVCELSLKTLLCISMSGMSQSVVYLVSTLSLGQKNLMKPGVLNMISGINYGAPQIKCIVQIKQRQQLPILQIILAYYDCPHFNGIHSYNYKMILPQQGEFKKSEAIKLFHLVQQTVPMRGVLTDQVIRSFLAFSGGQSISPMSVIQTLDPVSKEMTADHFGNCISQFFEEKVSCYDQFANFNKKICDLLLGLVSPIENELFKIRKEMLKPPIYDKEAQENYEKLVGTFFLDIKYRQDYSNFSEILKMINYSLASVYDYNLFYLLFSGASIEKSKLYICNDILELVFRSIAIKEMREDVFKYLNYVTESLMYNNIKKEVVFRTLFFDSGSWNVSILAFELICKAQDQLLQKTLLAAFLANFSEKCSDFTDYLNDWLERTPNAQAFILNPLQNINEVSFIKFVLEIYHQLTKRRAASTARANLKVFEFIEQFALRVLTTGFCETCESAIRLIAQTVKLNLGNYLGEREISVVVKALEANEQGLISAALQVLQNGLKWKNEEVVWMFTRRKNCVEFIRLSLEQNFGKGSPSFHGQCIQIVSELIKPQLLYLFEQHRFLETLFYLLNTDSGVYFQPFISGIIVRLARESCRHEKSVNLMKKERVLELIFVLLRDSYRQDPIIHIYLNGYQCFNYMSKQMFINCVSALFILNKKPTKAATKLFQADKSIGVSTQIINRISEIMKICRSSQFFKAALREEVAWGSDSTKVYKLIFAISQQLLVCCKEASAQVRRRLFASRNVLLFQLYAQLTYNELEAENIPIFIHYEISALFSQWEVFERYLPAKYNYQSLKTYLLNLLHDKSQSIDPSIVISDILITVKEPKCQIRNEMDYRKIINRLIKNHPSEYRLQIQLQAEVSAKNIYPMMESRLTMDRDNVSVNNRSRNYGRNTEYLILNVGPGIRLIKEDDLQVHSGGLVQPSTVTVFVKAVKLLLAVTKDCAMTVTEDDYLLHPTINAINLYDQFE